jgi:Bacterial domain of unknown function (DUF403).
MGIRRRHGHHLPEFRPGLSQFHRVLPVGGRENARAIREVIPYEMWNYINMFYHLVHDAATRPLQVVKTRSPFARKSKCATSCSAGSLPTP